MFAGASATRLRLARVHVPTALTSRNCRCRIDACGCSAHMRCGRIHFRPVDVLARASWPATRDA
jgi:hypothetical protein